MTIPDPLRRSTPTPFAAHVWIMGRAVRLETNRTALLESICDAVERNGGRPASSPAFLWRLVIEPDGKLGSGWPEMAGFSDSRLSLVNFGQRSFIAVDRDGREAVGFLEEGLMREKPGFVRPLLDVLITLTAPSLGLRAASVARVARETGKPILLRQP